MRPNQQAVVLFPASKNGAVKSNGKKSHVEVINEIIATTPRKDMPGKSVSPGQKTTAGELKKYRDVIGTLFNDAKVFDAWVDAVKINRLMNDSIVTEKFGTYDEEFGQLHKAVQDAFRMAGRPDLADSFGTTVAKYTSSYHPVDFIATLLKGASNPVSVQATANQYAMVEPFRTVMADALTSRGVAAPSDIATLTQLFYNTFIAKEGSENAPMNFETMPPDQTYHADAAIVDAVVAYAQNLQNQKASGKQLSKIQDKIATAAEKVKQSLTATATAEVNKEIGGTITRNSKTIMIVAGVLLVVILYFAFKK